MAKEILGYYGPDASKSKAARASKGGIFRARDVNNYSPRKGLLRLVTEVLALADRTTDVVRDSKEPKDEKEVGPE